MHNRSELTANQFLTSQQRCYNKKLDCKNTVSSLAWFVLVFGAIGFLLTIAYFG